VNGMQQRIRGRTTLGLALVGTAALLATAACGGGTSTASAQPTTSANWDDVLAAAKQEGSLQVYSAQSQAVVDHITAGFQKAHPEVKLNVFKTLGNTLVTRVQTEERANQHVADIIEGAPEGFAATEQTAGKINTKATPKSVAGLDEVAWHDGIGAEDLIVPTLIYNTKLVPQAQAPKDWPDLLDPQWKGKISLYEPIPNLTEVYEYWMQTYGEDFLTKLKAQNPRIYSSGSQNNEAVESGAEAIGVTVINHAGDSINSGAPLKYNLPPKSPVTGAGVYMTSTAPHPNAALVYLDWVMSPDGQKAINGGGIGSSAVEGVTGSLPRPDTPVELDEQKVTADYTKIRNLMGLT
jgi:iron(III) transport system substrate-binding protein